MDLAARARCRAQHERRGSGPLPRRPGALECPRPRDGEPAAARAARSWRVHGAPCPVGVRPRARRPVATGPARGGSGRWPRVPVRPAGRPFPGRVGGGACAAGARAALRLGGARGQPSSPRSGWRRWPSRTTATAASSTSRRFPRPTRRWRRRPSRSGSRSRSAWPASSLGGKTVPGTDFHRRRPVAARDPGRRSRGRLRCGRCDGRGRDAARDGRAPALAPLRPVPGARPGGAGRPCRRARPRRAAALRPPRRGPRPRRRGGGGAGLHGPRRSRAGPFACAGDASLLLASARLRRRLRGRDAAAARGRPGLAGRLRADRRIGGLHDPHTSQGAGAYVPRRSPTQAERRRFRDALRAGRPSSIFGDLWVVADRGSPAAAGGTQTAACSLAGRPAVLVRYPPA